MNNNFIFNLEEIKPGMLIKTAVPNGIYSKKFRISDEFSWTISDKIMIVLDKPIEDPEGYYFFIKVFYDGKIGYILWSNNGETNLIYEI